MIRDKNYKVRLLFDGRTLISLMSSGSKKALQISQFLPVYGVKGRADVYTKDGVFIFVFLDSTDHPPVCQYCVCRAS